MVLPAIFPAISAIGTGLTGAASVYSAIRGGGGGSSGDYSSLYAAQLAPGNTLLTAATNELAQLMAPYIGTEAAQTQLAGRQAYDQFNQALNEQNTLSGLRAGIASQYASSAIGLSDLAGKAKIATEMMGPETAADLASQFGKAAQAVQERTLLGETSLLEPTARAAAQAGLSAQQMRNKQVSDVTATNLDIRRSQEDTRNKMALQRANIEGQLALKRFGASQVGLAGARFA